MRCLVLLAMAISVVGCSPNFVDGSAANPPPKVVIPAIYDGCACTFVARRLAWSIDHSPKQWSTDGFTFGGPQGDRIWIANGEGNVSAGKDSMGMAWKPPAYDQALLWRAYQRWAEHSL